MTSAITERAARWRADADPHPGAVGAMDQRVMERREALVKQGALIRSGRTAGAGALLALQATFKAVTEDPRTGVTCPCCETYTVLIECAYSEGELASHMIGSPVVVDEPERPAPCRRWRYMVIGALAWSTSILAAIGLDDVVRGWF